MNQHEKKDYVQRLINEHGKDKARDMLSCSDSPQRFACLKLLEEQDRRDAAIIEPAEYKIDYDYPSEGY